MMKNIKQLILVFLTIFLLSAFGCSNEFKEGSDAYKRKDYKTAFKLVKPLAEQGNDDVTRPRYLYQI
jgi:uncharacterized lipoprotein